MKLPQKKMILFLLPTVGLLVSLNSLTRSAALVGSYFEVRSQVVSKGTELIVSGATSEGPLKYFKEEQQFSRRAVDIITRACSQQGIRITKILPPTVATDGDVKIATQQIILEGNFISLLKSVSAVKRDLVPAKIVCLKFEVIQATNKSPILILNLFFQGIIMQQ